MQAPHKMWGFLFVIKNFKTDFVKNKQAKHLKQNKKMLNRQYISIHQRCPLGDWNYQLQTATVLQPISDRFNGGMEKLNPFIRPKYAQT